MHAFNRKDPSARRPIPGLVVVPTALALRSGGPAHLLEAVAVGYSVAGSLTNRLTPRSVGSRVAAGGSDCPGDRWMLLDLDDDDAVSAFLRIAAGCMGGDLGTLAGDDWRLQPGLCGCGPASTPPGPPSERASGAWWKDARKVSHATLRPDAYDRQGGAHTRPGPRGRGSAGRIVAITTARPIAADRRCTGGGGELRAGCRLEDQRDRHLSCTFGTGTGAVHRSGRSPSRSPTASSSASWDRPAAVSPPSSAWSQGY